MDRLTRCIVGWAVVEERTFDTLQPVVDQVPRTCQQFYSDGLNTYPTLLYYNGKHEAHEDKRQTYSVEAVNADIRHYLARLARRSRCFCRKVESLRQAFWLFVSATTADDCGCSATPSSSQRSWSFYHR